MKYLLNHNQLVVLIAITASLWLAGEIAPAQATQSAEVSWQPSPSINAVGYRIYYGTASGVYTNFITVGNVTNALVSGLADATTYYFAGRAVDADGFESSLSPEATYAVPSAAPTLAAPAAAAGSFSFTVSGVSGYSYVVEASSNLLDWIPVFTNIAPFTFQDPQSGRPGSRFYRSIYYQP